MSKSTGSRGIEAPRAHDMALIGDTRHNLHTAPLSKGLHVGGGKSIPVGGGSDPQQTRYDDGAGTGMADDNC